jgi:DNA-binding transcriptional ArsR family regulator
MENKFLKLTDAVYKVLEFFPESDPLKNRAKDKALAIMDNLVLINETSGGVPSGSSFQKEKIKVLISEDIDMLLGYIWIAKSQGWLNSANCLIIANEYEKIRKSIEPETDRTYYIEKSTQEPIKFVLNNTSISKRQEKILDFLEKNKSGQVMDLQSILGNITKRTIRRDLDELLLMGKITRMGEFNQVFYKIK